MAITAPPTPPRAAPGPPRRPARSPSTRLRKILAVWASAMVPMGLLAWVVAPWLAGYLHGPSPLTRSLILCLTAGLVWQFVLVMIMFAFALSLVLG